MPRPGIRCWCWCAAASARWKRKGAGIPWECAAPAVRRSWSQRRFRKSRSSPRRSPTFPARPWCRSRIFCGARAGWESPSMRWGERGRSCRPKRAKIPARLRPLRRALPKRPSWYSACAGNLEGVLREYEALMDGDPEVLTSLGFAPAGESAEDLFFPAGGRDRKQSAADLRHRRL